MQYQKTRKARKTRMESTMTEQMWELARGGQDDAATQGAPGVTATEPERGVRAERSFGGLGARAGSMAGVGVVAAMAGAAAAVGAGRLDRIGDANGSAELIAGIALFASGLLAAVVCVARTRLEAQDAEIERLSLCALDAELLGGMGIDRSLDGLAADGCPIRAGDAALERYLAELDGYQVLESGR